MAGINSHLLYHALPKEEVLSALNTDITSGLSEGEAADRLVKLGPNSITASRGKSAALIFLGQFKSPLILLLFLAALFSFWFKEWLDASAILAVILVNVLIGFYMEFQAEKSMQALKKLSAPVARVIRNGQLKEISSHDLVNGDIAYVEPGDMVPADGRIYTATSLKTDESALTGESVPVDKQANPVDAETVLAERDNMLYKGTFITHGNAHVIITATGMNTELGKVASLVQSAKQAETPLEKKLESFSKVLIKVTVVLVALIFTAGLINGKHWLEMLKTSVALAVAAIPEGLPIVATMALAQGMLKMARHKVLIKKLSAVETLGGTSVICTDKTGTLTKNKIEVEKILATSGTAEKIIHTIFTLCNTAELFEQKGTMTEVGDPLETGLLKYAAGKGINIDELRKKYPKLKEEPFSSETKIMATLHKTESGYTVYAKGAVEELLLRCNRLCGEKGEMELDEETRSFWLKESEKHAASGLKVIGCAYSGVQDQTSALTHNLIFAGIAGMKDPPREDVLQAIKDCSSAGIKIVMITGDHPATARNIAYQLNISDNENAPVIMGKDMKDYESLSETEKNTWASANIFARVSPKQKLDIISVLQEKRYVVGMTGDGINDAPAIKKADIGIAMGERGTQVAQEVSDMILKDDSFASIVLAIRYGRVIFENIRKFVVFLLSCNLSELIVIAVGSVMNLPFQLFPLQILFINLITDVFPALALGVTEGGGNIMQQLPRNINEPIINKKRWIAIMAYSIVLGCCSIGAVIFSHYTLHQGEPWHPQLCNNVLFYSLILCQLLHVFNMTDGHSVFFKSEVIKNKYVWMAVVLSALIVFAFTAIPPLSRVLSLHGLSAYDWFVSIGAGFSSLIINRLIIKLKLF